MRRSAEHLLLRFASVLALFIALYPLRAESELSLGLMSEIQGQVEFSKLGARVTYYEVSGDSLESRRAQAAKMGPIDQAGFRREALTKWNVSWGLQDNVLLLSSFVQVVLPYAGQVLLSIKEEQLWTKYIKDLRDHELVHVILTQQHLEKLSRDVEAQFGLKVRLVRESTEKMEQAGPLPSALEEYLRAQIQQLNIRQARFDELTNHGKIPVTDNLLNHLDQL